MTPLNAREWLEAIVRTGAQRSGFAADALRELDENAEAAQERDDLAGDQEPIADHLNDAPGKKLVTKAEWVGKQFDDWGELTGQVPWADVAATVTGRLDQFADIVRLLQDAGVVAVGDVPDDLVGLLGMFVHGV